MDSGHKDNEFDSVLGEPCEPCSLQFVDKLFLFSARVIGSDVYWDILFPATEIIIFLKDVQSYPSDLCLSKRLIPSATI